MVNWESEIGSALIVAAIFLVMVGLGELLRGTGACSQEGTRKFVHFTGGIVSLSFAYVFASHWTVLGLGIVFIGLMTTKKNWACYHLSTGSSASRAVIFCIHLPYI